ncbi:MarR family transcriptional regulator [Halorientalis halophila]|uniref:DUF7845 domain-containing protein n=1 Tax=Halorientalis halophila TaxID=3108499 RepID=UPI0030099576
MRAVDPAPHEFAANFLFAEDGLAPFFAADSQVKAGGGSQRGTFVDDGEEWVAKLYYQDSGIVHPGSKTPTGTDWRLDEMREFRLSVQRHPREDSVGEQDFNAHLAPRWQGMEVEKNGGDTFELDVPEGIEEAVNVRINGSNIEFTRYRRLLKKAALSVGINGRYFDEAHEYSNVQDAEMYVRVHKDASGPVHARDGPIASMGHLLENDRRGYRKVVQNDDNDHGQNLPGYYHTATLDRRRIREAFPDHRLPKEIKHYYAREALSFPEDHPLRHPKVGASYQASLMPDGEHIPVDEESLEELTDELNQTVHSVLVDAGLDVAPEHGDGPFVSDAYFEVETSDEHRDAVGLDLAHIRHEQESVVVKHLADGLSPVQWESLDTLVSDGGQVSPADIAGEHGRHVDSVRRALREIEDLVEREYGSVSLRSTYVAELVHDAVQEARDTVQKAAEAGARALEAAERGLDERTSAFLAWASKYGVDVDDCRDARMKLRLGDLDPDADPSPEYLVGQAFKRWRAMNRDEEQFRTGVVEVNGGRYDAWRLIPEKTGSV